MPALHLSVHLLIFCTKRTSKSQRFKRGGSTIVLNVKRFHISAAFERGFDFKHTKVLQPVFQLKNWLHVLHSLFCSSKIRWLPPSVCDTTFFIKNGRAKLEPPPRGASPLNCHKKFLQFFGIFKNWSIFHFQILQFKCYQNTPNLDAFNLVKTCFLTFVLSQERLSFTMQTIPICWTHIFQLYSTFKNATFL